MHDIAHHRRALNWLAAYIRVTIRAAKESSKLTGGIPNFGCKHYGDFSPSTGYQPRIAQSNMDGRRDHNNVGAAASTNLLNGAPLVRGRAKDVPLLAETGVAVEKHRNYRIRKESSLDLFLSLQ